MPGSHRERPASTATSRLYSAPGAGPSLTERCREQFTSADRRLGDVERYRLNRVGGTSATAVVTDTAPHTVTVDWSRTAETGVLRVTCGCSRFADGALCKHLWATLVALDREGHGARVPGPETLGVSGDPDLDEERREPEEDAAATFDRRRPIAEPPPTGGSDPELDDEPWRLQLDRVRGGLAAREGEPAPMSEHPLWRRRREAWYLLDLQACLTSGRLVVDFHQRQEKKNGEMGKVKSLALAEEEIESFSDPEDRELLRLLLAANPAPADLTATFYSYARTTARSKRRQAVVLPALYDLVLPPLCATGRCGWIEDSAADPARALSLAWDDGEPYRLALHLAAGEEPEAPYRLSGVLARPGDRRPLAEPELLLAGGLAVFADRLARLETGDAFSWIVVLRRDGEIEIPRERLNAFFSELAALASLPELELPPELALTEERRAPLPRLVLSYKGRSETAPAARLAFGYGEMSVAAGHGPATLIDPVRRLRLPRDLVAEEAALARLAELGVRPAAGRRENGWPLELASRSFAPVVETLLAEGWRVDAEDRRLRRPGALAMRVSSGVDWFDLAGEIDFDGQRLELPRLLEAVRRGERTVRLGDGSQGMLPSELVARWAPLAALVHEDGEAVRILPSQTLLLDALLAEDEVEVDRRFNELRHRLRSFAQIEPENEPPGFCGTLRPYQREGLGWLSFLAEFGLGGCLADDMGLGKTVQVLALLESRRGQPAPGAARGPHQVVAPRSLVYNWLDEAARFTPELELLDYTGAGRAALRRDFDRYDVVVTTYGTLRRDIAELRKIELDYVILDEAQAIKNPSSQSAKACRLLRARHRLALTGTPVENRLAELWSIFEFLNPGMLGRLPRLERLGAGAPGAGTDPGAGAGDGAADEESLEAVSRALRPVILRRTKEQVLSDLPPKTEQTLLCELTRRERRLYDELRDHYRSLLAQRIGEVGLGRSQIQVLEALLRLRQAACHPGLLDAERRDEKSAKLETLLEQVEEVLGEGHKALVFSQFVSLLSIVRRRLDQRGIVYEYLDGKTRDRKQRVDRFQSDPACPLFLISLKAGGLGLNLTAADYVFLLDPWWNPAVEAQAVDRAHRIGQERPVFAYRLIARDTVEEKIRQLQESKRELARRILSADKSAIRELTVEDLRFLLG